MLYKHKLLIIFFCLLIGVSSFLSPVIAQQCTDTDLDGFFIEGGSCGPVDCDDTNNTVYPGAPLICDGLDNNCDGYKDYLTDEDKDGDGVPWCGGDCDDNHPSKYPGNQEGPFGDATCSDGLDNDCNKGVDWADIQCQKPCTDEDGDGYGKPGNISCPQGTVSDCNDNDPGVNPGVVDINCNNIDENCNGFVDEGYAITIANCGYANCSATGFLTCVDGVEINTCVPESALTEGPAGDPTCYDNMDNDCDGNTDSYDAQCIGPCPDNDGDGFGDPGMITCYNGPQADCNDNDANINPGAVDSNCNNIDENCDGLVDEAYVMTISDCGLGICSSTGVLKCLDGIEIDTCIPGLAQTEGPVDDPTCYDSIDNNCDGETDFNDAHCIRPCLDNDGDGYGNPGNPACPNGPVVDCNDNDPDINPDHIVNCDSTNNDCYSYSALTWNAPVINVDGSDLNDLAGYRIYYGETSDTNAQLIDVGNNTCYIISNLTSQEWCFAVTAYDILGNESDISNEVCKFIN